MTTLERINKQIAYCEEERDYWKERDNLRLYDYYDGTLIAYKHVKELIEADKDFNNYSF